MNEECQFGQCKHGPDMHINGNCYAITEPDKHGVDKFCKCDSQHGGNLRLFRDLGYMVEQPQDMLVSTTCGGCGDVVLLRRDETLCGDCKEKQGIKKRILTEIPEFHIFQPLPQLELQKIL